MGEFRRRELSRERGESQKDQWPIEEKGSKMKERDAMKKNEEDRERRVSVAKMRAEKMKRLAAGRKWQNNALWRWGEYIVRDNVAAVTYGIMKSDNTEQWDLNIGGLIIWDERAGGNFYAFFTKWLLVSAQCVRNMLNSKCRQCFHKRHREWPANTDS